MQAPDSVEIDSIEDRLALLPSVPDLAEASTDEFRRRRARIHQRHNEWRRGMPAIDDLFDNDPHRAKALAGSLATELERTLELLGEMGAGRGAVPDWASEVAAEWRATAGQLARCWQWGDEANVMFALVLGDLSDQAVARAEAGERPRSERSEVHVSRLRRFGIISALTIKRFFRPSPAGR